MTALEGSPLRRPQPSFDCKDDRAGPPRRKFGSEPIYACQRVEDGYVTYAGLRVGADSVCRVLPDQFPAHRGVEHLPERSHDRVAIPTRKGRLPFGNLEAHSLEFRKSDAAESLN